MSKFLLYAAYGLLSSVAILMLRKSGAGLTLSLDSESFQRGPILLLATAGVLYVASFGLWALILSRSEVTVAYPVCFGLTLVISTLLAIFLLNETMTVLKFAGMALIFAGALLVVR